MSAAHPCHVSLRGTRAKVTVAGHDITRALSAFTVYATAEAETPVLTLSVPLPEVALDAAMAARIDPEVHAALVALGWGPPPPPPATHRFAEPGDAICGNGSACQGC